MRFYSIAMFIFMLMLSFNFIDGMFSAYVTFPHYNTPSSEIMPSIPEGGSSTGSTSVYTVDFLAQLQWITIFIQAFLKSTIVLPWVITSFLPSEAAWMGFILGLGFQFTYIAGLTQFISGRMMKVGR